MNITDINDSSLSSINRISADKLLDKDISLSTSTEKTIEKPSTSSNAENNNILALNISIETGSENETSTVAPINTKKGRTTVNWKLLRTFITYKEAHDFFIDEGFKQYDKKYPKNGQKTFWR